MNARMETACPLSKGRMIFLFLNYFLGFNLLYPLFMRNLTIWMNPMARSIPQWMQFLIYLWMIISSIYAAWPLLQESIKGWSQYKKRMAMLMLLLLLLYYISSIVVNIIVMQFSKTDTSANQSAIVNSLAYSPYLTLFSAIVYAPIVEEILFRGVFYRALRPHMNWLASAMISAFMFGFIHVMHSFINGNFSDLIYLLSYALVGFFLTLAYEKSESIYGSMLLHFLNNAIAFLLLVA